MRFWSTCAARISPPTTGNAALAGGTIAFSGNVTAGSSPGIGTLTLTAFSIIERGGGTPEGNLVAGCDVTGQAQPISGNGIFSLREKIAALPVGDFYGTWARSVLGEK